LKALGVARRLSADEGSAVGTGIQEDANLTVAATHQDDPPTGDMTRLEISGTRDFGFMSGINPALLEDPPFLELEDGRVGEHAPINPKEAILDIVDHEVPEGAIFHGDISSWP
jgi:hypothetical protein